MQEPPIVSQPTGLIRGVRQVSEVAMKGPLDIHQYLLAHDVRHEIVRLPRTPTGAPTLAQALGLPADRCIAVHPFQALTASGEHLVVLLTAADLELDIAATTRTLAELLGARLGPAQFSVARAELVSARTDYLAGHLAPLLLPPEVIVVATQRLVDLAVATVYTATGDAGTALALRAVDLLDLTGAIVAPKRRRAARRRAVSIDLSAATPQTEGPRPTLRTTTVARPIVSKAAS
jgi:Cys-tRNA(Pro)/Cys-tRNA(Cys) deacylase